MPVITGGNSINARAISGSRLEMLALSQSSRSGFEMNQRLISARRSPRSGQASGAR
jgi:hypothetical protein